MYIYFPLGIIKGFPGGTSGKEPACQFDPGSGSSPAAAAAAKSLQLCPTLCDPIDGSPPGSPIPGILQARILEWFAISFSDAWKLKVKVKSLSHVWLLATPWTAAYQAPLSLGLFRQEYWSGVPSPSPTRDQIHIPYIGRWILNHWTTREVPCTSHFLYSPENLSSDLKTL